MNQVGFAGGAGLSGVITEGELVGAPHQFAVVIRAVRPDLLNEVTELGNRQNVRCDLLAQGPHTRLYPRCRAGAQSYLRAARRLPADCSSQGTVAPVLTASL